MMQGRLGAAPSVPATGAGEQEASRIVMLAVAGAKRGERDALGFLYARYADDVFAYARSIVRDHHEAEDATQQVFAKLIHSIGKYEQREAPFLAWLLRVTRNVALDQLRKRHPIPVAEVRLVDSDRRPASLAGHAEELTYALALLPHAQREVLVLRHFAGLTPLEIAARTGRTEASVHGLHHRGRRTLTQELAARGLAPSTAPTRPA